MALFAQRKGNSIIMPNGDKMIFDGGTDDATCMFGQMNVYGRRCWIYGSLFTAAGVVAGVLLETIWVDEIKPRIKDRKNKRTGA